MNLTEYDDEDLLMLSGIQHIAFCERQWALIHIEQQWDENLRTIEGRIIHERVDNPFFPELRNKVLYFRSVQLTTRKLGLYGKADMVEWHLADSDDTNTVILLGYEGKWKPMPVEYKRGKPKSDERDEVQLCAQTMCLEEAHKLTIEKGALYYGETRHRHEVIFNSELRRKVEYYAGRMHKLFQEGITPLPVYKPHCHSCSLVNICLPKTFSNDRSVEEYLKALLEDDNFNSDYHA